MGYWSPNFDNIYEEFGSRRETYGNTLNAFVTVRVPWDQRIAVITDMIENGWSYPDNAVLFCQDANLVGTRAKYENPPGDTNQEGIKYDEALITLTYLEAPRGGGSTGGGTDPETGDVVTVSDQIVPEFQVITVTGRRLQFPTIPSVSGRILEEGEDPIVLERRYTFTRTIDNLSWIKPSILNLYGTVNDAALQSELLGKPAINPDPAEPLIFEPETLLLNGTSISYNSARKKFSVAISYSWKQIDNKTRAGGGSLPTGIGEWAGHNHFYDPETDYYRKTVIINRDGTSSGFNPYAPANQANILFPVVPDA